VAVLVPPINIHNASDVVFPQAESRPHRAKDAQRPSI